MKWQLTVRYSDGRVVRDLFRFRKHAERAKWDMHYYLAGRVEWFQIDQIAQ
jgi:hypothetical protein